MAPGVVESAVCSWERPREEMKVPTGRCGPPRGCASGGGRSSVQQRQVRFQAVATVLISESLDPELREQALKPAALEIIEGAIAGDPVLLRRVFDGAMRGWW